MVAGMFFSVALAMIFTQVAGVVANIIDGIVTSRILGESAYSAVSLLGPYTSMLGLLASFLSTGCQVVCSQLAGSGKKDEANQVFSLVTIVTAVLSVLLVASSLLFPRELFSVCGVSPEKNADIYPKMLNYLHGYLFGIPALMLIEVLGPIIVMDGGKKLFGLSATVLCVADVAGDLANALVFHGGAFGMGVATSAAFIIQLAMLVGHFLRKDGYFRISLRGIQGGQMGAVARAGSPTFVRKLATILRDLLVNRMNLAVALSTAAIAARGVQNDLNTLMFCIGMGVGKTLLSMTGIYYWSGDKQGLRRLFIAAAKTAVLFAGMAGLACFVGAHAIASLYLDDPEAVALSVFSIRCMAVSLVLDALLVALQNYLQGIGNRKLVNVMNFGERLFIPVFTAFVLGRFFGSEGIMASLAVSKALLALLALAMVCVHCKRLPRHWEDFMFLPEGFGGAQADSHDAQIFNMDDVVHESEAAERFCLDHGTDAKRARWMALFVEEMAGNIVQHGKPRKSMSASADLRLYVNDGRICLCLRDYCEAFDPTRYYETHQGADADQSLGIRMVMGLATEVQYYNTFNSNNLLLYVD
mgnify:CR=1 FL=1